MAKQKAPAKKSKVGHRYKFAPIREAIIDLRVETDSNFSIEKFREGFSSESTRYPSIGTLHQAEGMLELGKEIKTSTTHTQLGYALRNDTYVCQLTSGGFTLSRLALYTTWDEFSAEARRLWNIYRSVRTPKEIKRLAVRYINQIDLPLPFENFNEYLRTVPEVSPVLPQSLEQYFMRLVVPLKDIQGRAIINEALVGSSDGMSVSIILDIDVSRDVAVPAEEKAIWNLFEKLRDQKNTIFEGCITPKTRKLFNHASNSVLLPANEHRDRSDHPPSSDPRKFGRKRRKTAS